MPRTVLSVLAVVGVMLIVVALLPSPADAATPATARLADTQATLKALGYYPGEVDGRMGPLTRSAVIAFQKVHGLAPDGRPGPLTRAALAAPGAPELRGGEADRVEVDVDRQVLYLVEGGVLHRVMAVSTGSGELYTGADGGLWRANTPRGVFRVERRIAGERHAPLGVLHDPLYFHRGWAIHGSDSVPTWPASHGCVRVSRADGRELFERVADGTQVIIY